MNKIGILFDIDKLGTEMYGQEAFRILFKATSHKYLNGCLLYGGDIEIQLPEAQRPYCFCIGISTPFSIPQELNNDLSKIEHPSLPCGGTRFYHGNIHPYLVHLASVYEFKGVVPSECGKWVAKVAQEIGFGINLNGNSVEGI